VSRVQLRGGDVSILRRLKDAPLEIGEVPVESLARLMSLGLVRKVLGCCEITCAGQLSFHRHQFLKASSRRVARVTRSNPLFLQEARFGAPASRTRLLEFLKMRRMLDRRIISRSRLPRWMARLASEPAEQYRHVDEVDSGLSGPARHNGIKSK
jgi:hypothetical protein